MRVIYLCEVYGVKGFAMKDLEVEYLKEITEIKDIDIPNSIIIDINKKWGIFEGISK